MSLDLLSHIDYLSIKQFEKLDCYFGKNMQNVQEFRLRRQNMFEFLNGKDRDAQRHEERMDALAANVHFASGGGMLVSSSASSRESETPPPRPDDSTITTSSRSTERRTFPSTGRESGRSSAGTTSTSSNPQPEEEWLLRGVIAFQEGWFEQQEDNLRTYRHASRGFISTTSWEGPSDGWNDSRIRWVPGKANTFVIENMLYDTEYIVDNPKAGTKHANRWYKLSKKGRPVKIKRGKIDPHVKTDRTRNNGKRDAYKVELSVKYWLPSTSEITVSPMSIFFGTWELANAFVQASGLPC